MTSYKNGVSMIFYHFEYKVWVFAYVYGFHVCAIYVLDLHKFQIASRKYLCTGFEAIKFALWRQWMFENRRFRSRTSDSSSNSNKCRYLDESDWSATNSSNCNTVLSRSWIFIWLSLRCFTDGPMYDRQLQ